MQTSIIALALILCAESTTAWAQDRSYMTTLNQAIRAGWVQFNIVGGRMHLENVSIWQNTMGLNGTRKDFLSFRGQNQENGEESSLGVSYELLNTREHYTFDIDRDGHLKIHFESKKKSELPRLDFEQNPSGKVTLTIDAEGKKESYSADNIWLLFLSHPEPAKKHLVPLLLPMQPTVKHAEIAEQLEKELLQGTNSTYSADREKWKRWIAELGDESFSRRQAADRELRAASSALLPYLEQIDIGRLDMEQQFRLHRIVESLTSKINSDTPEQIASWMSCDPMVWLSFLSRPEIETRRTAVKRLASILQGPIAVDPEADPASQKEQLEKLRSQIDAAKRKE
jgi:hypothetical protein